MAEVLSFAPSINRQEPEQEEPAAPHVPPPRHLEDTGLDLALLTDLAMKAIYYAGRPTGRQLAEQIALPFAVTEELLNFLRQEHTVEVVGTAGVGGEQTHRYALTDRGLGRAEEALGRSQYVGPAPIPFQKYVEIVRRQGLRHRGVPRDKLMDGLAHLVLERKVIAALGPAVNSGSSILIYGHSGNGKTSIAMAISDLLPGETLMPYAVEVDGQIIKVFDPRLHQLAPPRVAREHWRAAYAGAGEGPARRRDRRWAITKRPIVTVGGELTLKDLELGYSATSKFYIAPLQWKANGGVLIVDDFGRQLVQPQELLNRWIVPMEQGIDHLALHSGDVIDVPFDALLIFSTNIKPARLGDEAFFRRIRHKVEIPNPTKEQFEEILRRICNKYGIEHTDEGATYLMDTYYDGAGRDYKGCHPRDLMELLVDITRFFEQPLTLAAEWIDLACASYFVDTEEELAPATPTARPAPHIRAA